MSESDSIKDAPEIKTWAELFYQDAKVIKIEWWYSDCNEYPDLFWARFRKFSNGKADVLFQGEEKSYGFENDEFAGYFLSEDEFNTFEDIDEDQRNHLKIPAGVLIETPDWENKEVNNFEYIGTY